MESNALKVLCEKISKLIGEVGAIPKAGRNEHFNYDYRRHEDMMNKLAPALTSVGLVIYPGKKEIISDTVVDTKRGSARRVLMRTVFSITDGEAFLSFEGLGEGQDTGDKAVYKAQTGATKYALNDLLMIAADTDPENEKNGDQEKKEEHNKNKTNEADTKQIYEMASELGLSEDTVKKRIGELGCASALSAITKKYKSFLDAKTKEANTPPPVAD